MGGGRNGIVIICFNDDSVHNGNMWWLQKVSHNNGMQTICNDLVEWNYFNKPSNTISCTDAQV